MPQGRLSQFNKLVAIETFKTFIANSKLENILLILGNIQKKYKFVKINGKLSPST